MTATSIRAARVCLAHLAVATPSAAFAHDRMSQAPPGGGWTWDPWLIGALFLSVVLYAAGIRRLWNDAGKGRGIRHWEVASFGTAWVVLVAALLSPLDGWSDVFFSAHMSQHELLMLLAAPLIVLGKPLLAYVWALPAGPRRKLGAALQRPAFRTSWNRLTGPVIVLMVHAFTRWVWHAPALFEAALRNEAVHTFQHVTFFGTATMFWWALVHGRYGRLGYGVSAIFVFVTAAHTSILGAVLTFAPRTWYPLYEERAARLGLDALRDQQLAGLIMWVPGGALLVVVALAFFAAWLGAAGRGRDALCRS